MQRRFALALAAVAALTICSARSAHAEDFYIAVDWPKRIVDRPLVLGPSMFEFRGDTLGINLSKDAVGDPIFFAPDIYFGLDDRITLGYVHEIGLCLTGDGCTGTYSDFGLEGLFSIIYDGPLVMAARAGVTFDPLDPFTGGLHLGLPVRVSGGDLAVRADPKLYVGVFNRDLRKEYLDVPIQLQYQLTDENALLLISGVRGPLSGFGDVVEVPVGVGVSFTAARRVDLGAEFQFTNLAGRGGGISGRLLLLRFALRL
ncbi:hypothetical protein [Haliangium ochraceum]|uniref:Outer membrane protein beta-barrel domain-containing protein n=1 Tax=Haliangium ochraceum (strain DSM 14365 / JCM 11303 / SMP-2) TaxID=502025 RepID=D0LJA1_HALO1|nr:hypothetical protein [Haliangium ochraceum]ACY14948.1 conserved hypothetical protein [Haliangium ochraceum DSM 14365]